MGPYLYRPLEHPSDIRLLRLHAAPAAAAAQFEAPIQIDIEHHVWLSPAAKLRFDLDAAYHEARGELATARDELEACKSFQQFANRDLGQSRTDTHHAQRQTHAYEVAKAKFDEQSASYRARRREDASEATRPPLSKPKYVAVSYAWGTDMSTETISIIGEDGDVQSLRVRQNVAEMLRYLRISSSDRLLWIDSLSINQADLEEKESQVKQMGAIYADASRVVIWLGPLQNSGHLTHSYTENRRIKSSFHKAGLEPSLGLLKLPWFHRRWIIQEAGLASEAILRHGIKKIEFQEFVRRIERLQRSAEAASTAFTPEDRVVVDRLRAMANLQTSSRGQFLPRGLMNLLLSFPAAKCSDDRDILYALASLSVTSLPISYHMTAEELYMDFARLEAIQHPSILLSVAGAHPTSSKFLPSWTPDWRAQSIYQPNTNRSFDSAYKSKIQWNQLIMRDGNTLNVMAKQMDEVARVSTPHTLGAWVRLCSTHNSESSIAENIPELDLLKALTRSRGDLQRLSSDQHATLVRYLGSSSSSDERPPKFVERFITESNKTMIGRTCFITAGGAIGMGPEGIKAGDVLLRIPDSPSFTALRPQYESASIPLQHEVELDPGFDHAPPFIDLPSRFCHEYTVVGDCHVPRLVRTCPDRSALGLEDLTPFKIV
ncbi:hypothetical protein J4E81_000753 [Alternaria sp. BMP 2799]|nr:hypothetical protein J4E81_000753 [Alternaria sp. BMP 2799]